MAGWFTVRGMVRGRLLSCQPWLIWLLCVSVYLPSVLANVRGLGGPVGSAGELSPGVTVWSQFWAAATFAALEVAAAVIAVTLMAGGLAWRSEVVGDWCRRLGLRWSDGRNLVLGGPVGATVGYVAVIAGAAVVAAVTLSGLGISSRPTVGGSVSDPVLLAGDYLMSVAAGIGEELLLLSIPFALATRAGWKPWWVLALLVGLRLSIHLYYGAGSAFVVLWVPAAYLLYRATRSIGPLILGHVLYDLLATTVQRVPAVREAGLILLAALSVAGWALLAGSFARYWGVRRRPVTSAGR